MYALISLFLIANTTLLTNVTSALTNKRLSVSVSKNREDSFCTWKYCEVVLSLCKEIKTKKEEKHCKDSNKMVVKWSKSYIRKNNVHCCNWRVGNITSNYLYCVYGFYTKHCSCKYTIFKWLWDIRVKHCSNGFDCNFKKVSDEKCFDKSNLATKPKRTFVNNARDDKNVILYK